MKPELTQQFEAIASRAAKKKSIHNLQLEIAIPQSGISWRYGAQTPQRQFFIASTTKLFTTTLIYQQIDAGRFSLETKAMDILGHGIMNGLHNLNGKNYAEQITIRQLLSHTSGIADYFEQKPLRGKSFGATILANRDQSWSFEDILLHVRENLKAKFAPASGKAFYSDTNYQLLGRILEITSGKSFNDLLGEKILKPLNLNATYMFAPENTERYAEILPLYHGDEMLQIPHAMASFGCDGGMVSTTGDLIYFLQAFFNGKLFQPQWLQTAAEWRRIFFPLQYGVGLMRFKLPGIFTLFRKTPEFIGHSGASGTVLFYAPEKDLYVCAAVNQTKQRDLPFRLLVEAGMSGALI